MRQGVGLWRKRRGSFAGRRCSVSLCDGHCEERDRNRARALSHHEPPPRMTRALSPRLTLPDLVEALLDLGEASLDGRLELRVGENVGPVVFDALAHQFADIKRIDAAGYSVDDHFCEFGLRAFRR